MSADDSERGFSTSHRLAHQNARGQKEKGDGKLPLLGLWVVWDCYGKQGHDDEVWHSSMSSKFQCHLDLL